MKIGYGRVSTQGQQVDSQVDALEKAGCELIFRETVSGARAGDERDGFIKINQ